MNHHLVDLRAKWPQERDASRYSELAGFDFRRHLENGGVWMDIGCGKGIALSDFITQRNLQLVGVTPVLIEMDPRISQIHSLLPSDRAILAEYRGKLRMASDIYGALSYCEDPLEALIYEALLLAPNGVAAIATRLERFGSSTETRKNIQELFRTQLGCDLEFFEIETISDATGKAVGVLQIRIIATPESGARDTDIEDLLKTFQANVGRPNRTRPAWISEDGKARIWQVDYMRYD